MEDKEFVGKGIDPEEIPKATIPEITTVYSNQTSLEVGLFDFKLLFGLKMSSLNGKEFNTDCANTIVIISPQHAKALRNLLDENIRKYEESFGQINLGKTPNESA